METKTYEILNFKGKMDYLLSRPASFTPGRKYPLILFLHGAGTRGPEIGVLERNHGWNNCCRMAGDKCIVAAPHCTVTDWNEIMVYLIEFCEYLRSLPEVDTDRVYLTGNSMGGYGSWELGELRPEFFAAVAPLCGGGIAWNARRLVGVPVWAFHGLLDPTVDYSESVRMVNAINRNGGNAKLTIFEHLPHNIWTTVYTDPALYEWMLSQTKSPAAQEEKPAELNGEIYG